MREYGLAHVCTTYYGPCAIAEPTLRDTLLVGGDCIYTHKYVVLQHHQQSSGKGGGGALLESAGQLLQQLV